MSLQIYAHDRLVETLWVHPKTAPLTDACYVTSVQANSDELKRALYVTGLPQFGVSMKFYGDTAKHIVGNWFN